MQNGKWRMNKTRIGQLAVVLIIFGLGFGLAFGLTSLDYLNQEMPKMEERLGKLEEKAAKLSQAKEIGNGLDKIEGRIEALEGKEFPNLSKLVQRADSLKDRISDLEEKFGMTTNSQQSTVSSQQSTTTKACVNEASLADLTAVDGIGDTYGKRILDKLPVDSLDELLEVKGVGKSALESLSSQFRICG